MNARNVTRATKPREETARKRREILRAATAVFGSRGYSKGSLAEIADLVGMTHAGVLHHFGSKDGLLEALLGVGEEAKVLHLVDAEDEGRPLHCPDQRAERGDDLKGAVLAGVGWVVGALLLWTSPSWRTRDKLIGTFLVPGGLVGAAILVGLGTVVAGQSCVSTSSGPTRCTGFAFPPAVGVPMMFVLLLGPIFSMIWLVRTHRASRAPTAADASATRG